MWDARYSEPGFAYGREPNDFLREMADRIPPGPVLCIAEGEGRNAIFLAKRGHEVTAVDASIAGLEKLARWAAEERLTVRTVHADLADYVIEEGAFAGIVSIWAHLPPELRRRVHRQAVAGLRPGGVLVLEAYRPEQLRLKTGGPPVADMMMTLPDLRAELRGLDLAIARELTREVHEGKYHEGTSAVVQILGIRSTAPTV